MSYILEALRRAETERERKRRVPGLHAQPVPVVSPDESRPPRRKVWLWVVAGISVGVLLPLLWSSWPDSAAPEDMGQARVAAAGSVAPQDSAAAPDASRAPSVAPATSAAPPAPGEAAAPAPTPAAQAAAKTAPPQPKAPPPTTKAAAAKPGAARTQPEPAARPPEPVTRPPAQAATQATATGAAPADGARPAPAPTAVPANVPEPRLRSLAELPEDLRRGVPALSFGGSVYSEIAAQRMVILNGQVLREGDAVTDELLLEQIRPRSAVMRLRGQRFEIGF